MGSKLRKDSISTDWDLKRTDFSVKTVLDVLFPPRCAICDEVISVSARGICPRCRGRLSYVEKPVCYKCGKEVMSVEEEYCPDCGRKERDFIKGFPVFNYISPVSDSIMKLKYGGRQEYASFFVEEIYRVHGKELDKLGIEAIVPIPIHKKKYISRGYNQAELIADVLGKCMHVKVRNDILKRCEDTPPQKQLSDTEREINMSRAFTATEMRGELPETILLVDDIYTTGATVQACTKACMEKGIKMVYYTSVAIGAVD